METLAVVATAIHTSLVSTPAAAPVTVIPVVIAIAITIAIKPAIVILPAALTVAVATIIVIAIAVELREIALRFFSHLHRRRRVQRLCGVPYLRRARRAEERR